MATQFANKREPSTLHFFGHNCFLVSSGNDRLLIDPWLSDRGAFFGSWFQYPKNHLFQSAIAELSNQKKFWVYITHEHQDHFDLDTIRSLNKFTRFLVPRYKDGFLCSCIRELGFVVTELDDLNDFAISENLRLRVFISDVGVNHDSAILIKTDDFTYFNQNDCKIFDRLDQVGLPIDYYSVQFSGATWHPVCYTNYTDQQRRYMSQEKITSKFQNVLSAIRKLSPAYFIPSAGPAIFPFLDIDLSLGHDNIFVHQPRIHRFLNDNNIHAILYPRPGEEINSSTSRLPIDAPTAEEVGRYRDGLRDVWGEIEIDFRKEELVESVRARLAAISDFEIDNVPLLVFQWGENASDRIGIDLNRKHVLENLETVSTNIYRLGAEKKYFALMSSPRVRWQDLHLSLRATVYRDPDSFNNFINIFLFSDVSNIRNSLLDRFGTVQERIVVSNAEGERFEIDRFCPHQGADLCHARITEKNELVCPRHGWIYSLEDGGKAKHSDYTIHSRKLGPVSPATASAAVRPLPPASAL